MNSSIDAMWKGFYFISVWHWVGRDTAVCAYFFNN